MKTKGPFIPREEYATVRQAIKTLIERRTLSARDISSIVRIPEKEVLDHLEHIRIASHKDGQHLLLTPALCKKCGFIFRKRERLGRPGKCPVCRNEQIAEPLYGIR
jgi:predicted Zn-ribbon and HTH transcriptional regulator